MKVLGYLRVASFTTLNIVLNAATLGRYVWLEGGVRNGVFTNWAKRFRYKTKRFARPTTQSIPGRRMPVGRSESLYVTPPVTTVWPALAPP